MQRQVKWYKYWDDPILFLHFSISGLGDLSIRNKRSVRFISDRCKSATAVCLSDEQHILLSLYNRSETWELNLVWKPAAWEMKGCKCLSYSFAVCSLFVFHIFCHPPCESLVLLSKPCLCSLWCAGMCRPLKRYNRKTQTAFLLLVYLLLLHIISFSAVGEDIIMPRVFLQSVSFHKFISALYATVFVLKDPLALWIKVRTNVNMIMFY